MITLKFPGNLSVPLPRSAYGTSLYLSHHSKISLQEKQKLITFRRYRRQGNFLWHAKRNNVKWLNTALLYTVAKISYVVKKTLLNQENVLF